MTRLIYETNGGNPSTQLTFEQLIEFLRKAEEDCRELGKLAKIDRNDSIGFMWIKCADSLQKCQQVVSHLGNAKTLSSTGWRSKPHGKN